MESFNFETAYDNAACGLLTFSIDGTIIHLNKTLLGWLGRSEEELKNLKFSDLLHKGGKLYYTLFILPLLQMQDGIKEISLEINCAESSFPALFSATTADSADNKKIVNATIFKITDRKKYEMEILREKDEVKEENVAKTQVLKDVAFNQAHLIRAPLANILGLIDLLSEETELSTHVKLLHQKLEVSALKLDQVVRTIVELI